MDRVLMVGIIVLPLVMFLAFFGERIMTNTDENATKAKSEADALMDAVTN